MDRRDVIAAGIACACAPATLRAQGNGKLNRIGWLDYSSSAENLGIFRQALSARGWIDGKTYRIVYRGGDGSSERLAVVAGELVRLPADLIVAPGTAETLAARKATTAIPIVMTDVDDPVERGIVASLPKPGGNVTGVANTRRDLNAKLVSFVRDVVPGTKTVAALVDATAPEHKAVLADLQAVASALGLSLNAARVQRYSEVEGAFAAMRKRGERVLVVAPSPMFAHAWIADLAMKAGLALASTAAGYVYEGGLIAYTNDWHSVYDRAATFVDRILKGAKPAELPVELPTKFRLIVNSRTAGALGLAVPAAVMLRATQVIE